MKKSLGNLIDELIIVNMKIWACEDIKRDNSDDDVKVAEATRKTNILNPYRNELIAAIDEEFNGTSGQGKIKIYGKQ